ncbi:metalloregulator ArsR/SmtB family transcription factor [Lactobacillus sp. ESL0731]|uniref:ArsR/SmtB family transcription factor n=1 Tax=unclassified Lactobacillus TaxID=2620435 RepID=UPI0023F73A56|nr:MULTISPECIES: metalloregulator ArsR/SmtB family transcription factor [unclassified Lactobacillus]WEV50629.1 metalloregulator ArsR/SmtB family transcription factor [Lactobacillus sp. ESL0700]WEV61759.1 metalloregulator ArsR/SmtB family transcription factor [Lactobacillus sp. ESL0731]
MNIETTKTQKLASLFNALSEPNRINIIRILRDSNRELSCSEVSDLLQIAPSTVSYHFKALRKAGLTKTRQEAQTKYLSLNKATFAKYLPGLLDSL